MAIATLRSPTAILSGTYSFVQAGIRGTHDDVWPGSGESRHTTLTSRRLTTVPIDPR
ncbi:MAG TPA: hypothetical protein VHN56_11265 [Actinomycetota bacterium]|nr:hypothetical protein [Actinomycetota bacterium]